MLRYCFYFITLLLTVCIFCVLLQNFVDHQDEQQQRHHSFPQNKDSSCILANIIERKANNNHDRISLILHASPDRIDEKELVEQIENWNAPVSLAIAFYEKDTVANIGCISSFLRNLKLKHLKVDEFLSVHFLIENGQLNCKMMELKIMEPCLVPIKKEANLTAFEISTKLIKYPINKARNVARKFASTKFILVADLGHFFSHQFEIKMRKLANTVLEKNPKMALVYRIFETKLNATTQPKTKSELRMLMESNEAFEFHHIFNDHSIENLDTWFEEEDSSESASIQFFKKYDSPKWEPQFVSLPSIPQFDVLFRYPRRDNTVLRWEMCRAGFFFAVINNVFAYHKGLKSFKEMNFLNKVRRRLSHSMEEALGKFGDRMDSQYPNTKKKCPLINSKLFI